MTIKAYFEYHEFDATRFWNATNADIRLKGFLDGTGTVTSVAGQLKVQVAPFKCQSFDGMTIVSTDTEELTVTDNQTYRVVLYAKYNLFNPPTISLQVMDEATYLAHPEKDYVIQLVRLIIPLGATQVLPAYYDGSVRDGLTPHQRDAWRQTVADFASLPTDTQEVKDGDVSVDLATHTAWVYNAGTSNWDALSQTTDLENVTGRQIEYFGEDTRLAGDGLAGGSVRRSNTYYQFLDQDSGLSLHDHDTVADTIGLGMIKANVNGHHVSTKHIDYVMSTAKPAGIRYDLVWLEVWREVVAVPTTVQHETYGGGLVPFSTVRAALEDLEVTSDELAGENFDVNQVIATDDNQWIVTKWRVADMPDVDQQNVWDPNYQVDNGPIFPTNIDGNPFERPPGVPSFVRGKVWRATSPTSYDNYSWAIPLVVVKRTNAETGPADYIQLVRSDGLRYVFSIVPGSEVDLSARINLLQQPSLLAQEENFGESVLASGFLNYDDLIINPTTIGLATGTVLYIDGYPYEITGLPLTTFPDAPILPATSRHDFVYLEMVRATAPDQRPTVQTSGDRRMFLTVDRGPVTFFYQFALVVADVGTDSTPEDAMVTAGFTYESPGLWSRSSVAALDERVPIDNKIWAIPVALVHRMNQAAWARDTNPNGGQAGTRPDGKQWDVFDSSDVLDCRHKVVLPGEDLEALLADSQQKLLTGQLRTRMVDHPTWGQVAGTQLIEQTQIAVAATAGATNLPSDPDGMRYIWSEASEIAVYGETFNSDLAPYNGPYVQWGGPVATGAFTTLTIQAPPGAYILTDGSGQPIFAIANESWSSHENGPVISDSSLSNNFNSFNPLDLPWINPPGSTDSNGEPIEFTINSRWETLLAFYDIDPAAPDARLHVYYWVVYDRSGLGAHDGHSNIGGVNGVYNTLNQGIEHSPDEVLQVENLGVGDPYAVGPMLRKLTYTGFSGASLTITPGAVAAQYPEFTGTILLYGVSRVTRETVGEMGINTFDPNTEMVVNLDDAYGSVTIIPTNAFVNENVAVWVLFSDDDHSGWMDFRQHSHAIRGPFSWAVAGPWVPGVATDRRFLQELGAGEYSAGLDQVFTEEDPLRMGILDTIYSTPGAFGPTMYERTRCLVYWRPAGSPAGTPWEIGPWAGGPGPEPDMQAGGFNTGVFTFRFAGIPAPATGQEFLFVFPKITPLSNLADVLVTSKYTPYQGLDPVASTDLEAELHGLCVASGNPLITTRGTNNPLIQSVNETTGWVYAFNVSSDPSRNVAINQALDHVALVQDYRTDYTTQRHALGNVATRVPRPPQVFATWYPIWGLESDLEYATLQAGLSTNEIERSTLPAVGYTGAYNVLMNFAQPVPPLVAGSVVAWPVSIIGADQTALRSANYVKGTRGWTVISFLYLSPVNTASFIPGGSPKNWNDALVQLQSGSEYLEAPNFYSIGLQEPIDAVQNTAMLGIHCSLFSPAVRPGQLVMQVTSSYHPRTSTSMSVQAIGGTFDAFVPYGRLLVSPNTKL
jgi:hypothetical protein